MTLDYASPSAESNRLATRTADILLQIVHRAISIAVWCLAARVAVLFFRPMEWTAWLLPLPVILLCFSALLSLMVLWTARRRPDQYDEARGTAIASAILLALTLAFALLHF
jgi:hypothetical protein